MKYLQYIKKYFSVSTFQPLMLGRWNLKYVPVVVHRTIDLANEDHCGCCITQINEKECRTICHN
jgi:hypothetical protein